MKRVSVGLALIFLTSVWLIDYALMKCIAEDPRECEPLK